MCKPNGNTVVYWYFIRHFFARILSFFVISEGRTLIQIWACRSHQKNEPPPDMNILHVKMVFSQPRSMRGEVICGCILWWVSGDYFAQVGELVMVSGGGQPSNTRILSHHTDVLNHPQNPFNMFYRVIFIKTERNNEIVRVGAPTAKSTFWDIRRRSTSDIQCRWPLAPVQSTSCDGLQRRCHVPRTFQKKIGQEITAKGWHWYCDISFSDISQWAGCCSFNLRSRTFSELPVALFTSLHLHVQDKNGARRPVRLQGEKWPIARTWCMQRRQACLRLLKSFIMASGHQRRSRPILLQTTTALMWGDMKYLPNSQSPSWWIMFLPQVLQL